MPVTDSAMRPVFNQTDRTRLRERFFGATHTVLARL
ncbi:isopropylmalate isomerase [uncultured Sulfitobacter sp.]|nr:isopropylmalate isomerase [uncultured Sulfitobacter sp.]